LWGSFQEIIGEQYVLGRKCGWSVEDTNKMADFERQIYVNLVIKEIEEEKKAMNKKG
jgi:hypothetical protein